MKFEILFKKLSEKNLKINSVESITGGGFAYLATTLPGSSKYFNSALVTYSNKSKIDFGVRADTLKKYGAVSSETAVDMVTTIRQDLVISFTGNAGPTTLGDTNVGNVFIAVKYLNEISVEEFTFEGNRDSIRAQTIEQGIKQILKVL